MNDGDELERRLEAWLEETARPMPAGLLDEIVATAPRAGRVGVRATFPTGSRWRLAIAGVAAVAVVAVALAAALRTSLEPGSSGSPGTTSSASSPTSSPAESPTAPSTAPSTAPPTPTTAPSLGEWHRNNYNAGVEQLVCRESTDTWTCEYHVPDGRGQFSGENVTRSWTCPSWFPSAICDHVVAVYYGTAWYGPLEGKPGPTSAITRQEYVITEVGGQTVLQLYWDDQFVCPWYRTIEAARSADYTCVFAP